MKYGGIDLHSDYSAVVVTDGQDHVLEEKRVPYDLPVISPEPAVLANSGVFWRMSDVRWIWAVQT